MSQIPFSIDAFRANLINGIARNNLFLVTGSFPGAGTAAFNGVSSLAGAFFGSNASNLINALASFSSAGANSQVSFLCQAAEVPSPTITLGNASYMGRTFKFPTDRTYPEWTITLYNDGAYSLRKAFERWMELINTSRTNLGPNAMNNYMTEWSVSPLTREGNIISTYKLAGCWPTTLGAIALNMQADTAPSTFTATLAYQYFTIDGISN